MQVYHKKMKAQEKWAMSGLSDSNKLNYIICSHRAKWVGEGFLLEKGFAQFWLGTVLKGIENR